MFSISIASLVSLIVVLVALASGQRNNDCLVSSRYYSHNQLFSLPHQSHCIKYICWYGRVIRRIEACEVDNKCHRVGSTFEFMCTRYRCNRVDRGNFIYYQPEVVSTRCRDYNRECRSPGERFPFQMHGTYYPSCTCTVNQNTIRYRCISYAVPTPRRVGHPMRQSAYVGSPIPGISSAGTRTAYLIRGSGEDNSEVSVHVDGVRVHS